MGFLDHLKTARSWAQEGAASVERWAEIVEVGRKVGPFQSATLIVHEAGKEPYRVRTEANAPRGVKPEVGRHVFFHVSTHDGHDHYVIDWHKPPQYGGPAPEIVPDHLRDRVRPPQ